MPNFHATTENQFFAAQRDHRPNQPAWHRLSENISRSRSNWFEHELRLLPGLHQLRLRQDNPTINHFVGVNVFEIRDDGELTEFADEDSPNRQRRYQVATSDEPIKFRVAGPALIRIDQSDGSANILNSRTVAVGTEGRKFELYPKTGQDLGYFRIFEMLPATKTARSYRAEPAPELVRNHTADELVDGVIQQVAYFEEVKTIDSLSLRSPMTLPNNFRSMTTTSWDCNVKGPGFST